MADFKARDYILKGKQIIEEKPDFSQVETAVSKGKLYKDVDNEGDTYYYRGAVEDNYFKFGDKFYRIIRINGSGSIRLIYDGSKAYQNGDTTGSEDRQIGTIAYNSQRNDMKYVGFRYTQDEIHGIKEPSTILGADENPTVGTLNNWYESNIKDSNLEAFIDQGASFICDRSVSNKRETWDEWINKGGNDSTSTYTNNFGVYMRILLDKNPSFKCYNNMDNFSKEKGNQALKYSVGLITGDEVSFAGGVYNAENSNYYLCIGGQEDCWTMSPSDYSNNENGSTVWSISKKGFISTAWATFSYYVRPVINILGSVNLIGDGTMDSPYEITEPTIYHRMATDGAMLGGMAKNGKMLLGIAHAGDIIWEYEEPKPKIKSFAEASDNEIEQYLDLHYSGKINIADYWHVGDTRVVHIDITYSGSVAHVAQDMTVVIMDFNHDDLTTPINGKDKAAVTIGFREVMGNGGERETEYYWGRSNYPAQNNYNYSASPLRTWLNGGLLNALPTTFSPLIKEVNKKNLAYHTSTSGAPLITEDKIWFMSYPEVFGSETYNFYKGNENFEGTQYEYMKILSNRIKKANNNGSAGPNNTYYWLRSPSSYSDSVFGYRWCIVGLNGAGGDDDGGSIADLAPAFCL